MTRQTCLMCKYTTWNSMSMHTHLVCEHGINPIWIYGSKYGKDSGCKKGIVKLWYGCPSCKSSISAREPREVPRQCKKCASTIKVFDCLVKCSDQWGYMITV